MAKIVRVEHNTKSFLFFFHVEAQAKTDILACFSNILQQSGELNQFVDDLSKKMCNLAG
jgi:hypothetical protein